MTLIFTAAAMHGECCRH